MSENVSTEVQESLDAMLQEANALIESDVGEEASVEAQEELNDDAGGEAVGDDGDGDDSGGGTEDSGSSSTPAKASDTPPVGEGEDEGSKDTPKEDGDRKKLFQRLAVLTKRERELQKREKEVESLKGELAPLQEFMAKAKQDKFGAIEGLFGSDTFKQWVEYNLKDGARPPTADPQEKRLEVLEQREREREEAKRKEAEDAEVRKAIEAYNEEIREASRAPEFEILNVFGDEAREEAVQYARLYYENYGIPVDPVEANQKMEEYFRGVIKRGLDTEYGRSLIKEMVAAGQQSEEKPAESDKPKKKITNKISSTAANPKPVVGDLSEEDILAEATIEFELAQQNMEI